MRGLPAVIQAYSSRGSSATTRKWAVAALCGGRPRWRYPRAFISTARARVFVLMEVGSDNALYHAKDSGRYRVGSAHPRGDRVSAGEGKGVTPACRQGGAV